MFLLLRLLSFRYWFRHRGAFALSALGVAMGVAVFVAVQIANFSVLSAFNASLEAVSGRANLQISGGARGLPDTVYRDLVTRPDPRIRAAAPLLERTLFSPTLKANAREDGTSVLVLGIDPFSQAAFFDLDLQNPANASLHNKANVSNTRLQRGDSANPVWDFLLDPHAMAISGELARRFKLQVGSRIELFVGAQRKNFRVAAIVGNQNLNAAFGGDFVLLDIATAQEAFDELGRLSQIDLIVPENQVESVAQTLRAQIGKNLPPDARVQRPAQRSEQVGQMLSAFQLTLSALSCITLFVGAFLIYNTVAVAVVRRRAEAGILRAVGVEPARLTRLFSLEAALIGAFGSLIGIALGWILARYTLHEVSRTVSTLYVAVKAREIVMPLWLPPTALIGGTLLSIAASLPAAHEAGHVAPRQALSRTSVHQSAAHFARPLAIFGLVVVLLGIALCHPFFSARAAWIGFIATTCTLGGFAMTAPLLVQSGGRALQNLGRRERFGPQWLLAGVYLQRAIHRSGLIVAALMVSLAMTVGLGVMVGSFRATVVDWVDNTISADLFVAPARGFSDESGPGLPPQVLAYARKLPNVRAIDTIRGAQITIKNQPVFIAANTLPSLKTGQRRLRFVQTRNGAQNALDDFTNQRAILVSERFSNLLKIGAGQSVSVLTPRGPRSYPVAGVFYDYTPNQAVIYLPQPLYQRDWNDKGTDGLALYFAPGTDVAAIERGFQEKFGRDFQLTLLPNGKIRQQVFQTFDDTFAVTYALQLIAVIVAADRYFRYAAGPTAGAQTRTGDVARGRRLSRADSCFDPARIRCDWLFVVVAVAGGGNRIGVATDFRHQQTIFRLEHCAHAVTPHLCASLSFSARSSHRRGHLAFAQSRAPQPRFGPANRISYPASTCLHNKRLISCMMNSIRGGESMNTHEKKVYSAPQLMVHGDVETVTQHYKLLCKHGYPIGCCKSKKPCTPPPGNLS